MDREKTGRAIGAAFRILGAVAGAATGISNLGDLGDSMGSMMETLKGFKVNVNTYLYQLDWDEETAMTFYREYYASKPDPAKKKAFEDNRDKFHLTYIGSQKSSGKDVSFIGVNLDEPTQMIRKACQRAIDENIAYERLALRSAGDGDERRQDNLQEGG